MELEVFVHGAICIAHSGRCLMVIILLIEMQIRLLVTIHVAIIIKYLSQT